MNFKLIMDPGTEKYFTYAKQALVQLSFKRVNLRLPLLSEYYTPESGITIEVISSEYTNIIRISGGQAGRIKRIDTSDAATKFRWYYVKSGKLSHYGEAADTYAFQLMSFNGSTFVAADSATKSPVRVMRKETIGTTYTLTPGDFLILKHHGAQTQIVTNGNSARMVWDVDHGYLSVSKTGKKVYVSERDDTYGVSAPTALDVDLDVDELNTTTSVAWKGLPQFVLDFYSGLTIRHELHPISGNIPDVVALRPSTVIPAATPYWAILPTRFTTGANLYGSGGHGLELKTFYDTFKDAPCIMVTMPYVTAFGSDSGPNDTLILAERVEVRRYNAKTKVWDLINACDRPNVSLNVNGGVTEIYKHNGVTAHGNFSASALSDFDSAFATYASVGLDFDLNLVTIRNSKFQINGVDKYDVPAGYNTVTYVARDGIVLINGSGTAHTRWIGATWSYDAVSTAFFPFLSAHGDLAWANPATNAWDYMEKGIILKHYDAPPTADATSFLTYGTTPDVGFWFLKEIIAWRYDKPDQVKCVVYTHIEGPPPGGLIVCGGSIVIDGIGSVPVPNDAAHIDGFDLDGIHYHATDGNSYTVTEFATLLGLPPSIVHFVQNFAFTYELQGGSPVYTWKEATVDLKYDTTLSEPKITKTYKTQSIIVDARDHFGPGTDGATTYTTSEAALVQDYLLLRKP